MRSVILTSWILIPGISFFVGRSIFREPEKTSEIVGSSRVVFEGRVSQDLTIRDPLYERLQRLQGSNDYRDAFRGTFTDENEPMERDPIRHEELLGIADSWAAKYPQEAVESLNQLQIPDARNPYLFYALAQWARQEPEVALAWLKEQFADEQDVSRLYLTAGVIRGLAKTDPERAFEELLGMVPSPERRGAVDFLLQVWAQEGGENLTRHLEQLPAEDERLREAAFRKGMQYLPIEELASLNEWVEQLPNVNDRMTAQTAIAAQWAQRDSQAALEWAANLPEDENGIRSESLAQVASYWAQQQPEAALEWIDEHQGDPNYDRAIRSVAWNTVGYQHEAVFEKIAQITDPEARNRAFDQIGWMWLPEEPEEARQFFESTTLISDKLRYELLSNFY